MEPIEKKSFEGIVTNLAISVVGGIIANKITEKK